MKLTLALITVLAVASSVGYAGNTASTSAQAKANVKKSIAINKTADLDFGNGFTGDSASTVAPADSGAAQFTVTGEKNKAYNISIPTSITMTTDDGVGADKQITVNTFTSNPSGSGTLSVSGSQALAVGATRGALSATQESGDYAASFTITVTYQ